MRNPYKVLPNVYKCHPKKPKHRLLLGLALNWRLPPPLPFTIPGLPMVAPVFVYIVHIVPGTYWMPDGISAAVVFGHDTLKQNTFPKSFGVDVTTVEVDMLVVELLKVEDILYTI